MEQGGVTRGNVYHAVVDEVCERCAQQAHPVSTSAIRQHLRALPLPHHAHDACLLQEGWASRVW